MRKSLEKGPSDFRRNVTLWGIEGGSIAACPSHPSVLLQTPAGNAGGYKVIEQAWGEGHISSSAESAQELLDKVLAELPTICPECD